MFCHKLTIVFTIAFVVVSFSVFGQSEGKPWTQSPVDQPSTAKTTAMPCTPETENICQRCAKQTKSPVVYPWCCSNHEGAREWCESYLYYGLG